MKSILTITLIFIFATSFSQYTLVDPIEISAEFPGGETEMFCFIETQLNYSRLAHLETTGRLLITFIIERDGKLNNIKINPDHFPRAKDLIKDSIVIEEFSRVITSMPDWIPAKFDTIPIRSMFFLPFSLPYSNFKCPDYKIDSDIVAFPDNLPIFPIGEDKTNKKRLSVYINANIEWPKTQADCQGWVFIQAVVEKTGELTNIKTIRRLCPAIDDEALRVVKNMPAWKPGIKNGEPVRTVTVIPVRFVIN